MDTVPTVLMKNSVHLIGLHQAGPSCSKLTTSLVNDSLKFQTGILQIHCYFLLIKCENPLHESFAMQRILTFYQQKITVYLLM